MIAAIYCRKSTPQKGRDGKPVAEIDKSVERQEDDARAFCAARHWTVVEVYADDAIGGAEVTKLQAKQRMLDDIKSGRATFQVLVMQSNDRLSRRYGDEAFGELKAIAKLGVQVWFYSTGRQFEYGSFESNTLGFLNAEFAAQFRRDIAQKTSEALRRKFLLGHVVGGIVYGYTNVQLNSHTERVINTAEAAIVRRIFERYAAGEGLGAIAHELNAEGAPAPRLVARTAQPNTWSPSSVREILKRSLYRGFDVYGRSKKRNIEGVVEPSRQPVESWLRRECPELRIVPADIAAAVDARFEDQERRTLRVTGGKMWGRPPGEGSPYLLTGLLTCGVCGGSMEVLSSCNGRTGHQRVHHYRCYSARRKGPTVCTNKQPAPMGVTNEAVLGAIATTVLDPSVVAQAIVLAERALTAESTKEERANVETALRETEAAIAWLTSAIAAGGDLPSIVDALATQEARRKELNATLVRLVRSKASIDRVAMRKTLRTYLADWTKLLRGHVPQAQQILRRLIVDRLTMTPRSDGGYDFCGAGTVIRSSPASYGMWRPREDRPSRTARFVDHCRLSRPNGDEVIQPRHSTIETVLLRRSRDAHPPGDIPVIDVSGVQRCRPRDVRRPQARQGVPVQGNSPGPGDRVAGMTLPPAVLLLPQAFGTIDACGLQTTLSALNS